MLKVVKAQDWNANFAYAPPTRDVVLNTDEIVSVTPTDSRGIGPFVSVRMRDGSRYTCEGTVADFLE